MEKCSACSEIHRKVRIRQPSRKTSFDINHVQKVLGTSKERWFDELSAARCKQDEKKTSSQLYGKVSIQTELSSLTPSSRGSNRSIYASTPGQIKLTPMSAWARINSEESDLGSPITSLYKTSTRNIQSDIRPISSTITQLINEDLNTSWTSSLATPKVYIEQSSQESQQDNSTITGDNNNNNNNNNSKPKGFPRVLFSPGPGTSKCEELGFSLNTTADGDHTLLDVSNVDVVAEETGSLFHPALMELGDNDTLESSPAKHPMESFTSPINLHAENKTLSESVIESNPMNGQDSVHTALSDFFDSTQTVQQRKKRSQSRKRKSVCIEDATENGGSQLSQHLTPSSILKCKNTKSYGSRKKVRFGETSFSSDHLNQELKVEAAFPLNTQDERDKVKTPQKSNDEIDKTVVMGISKLPSASKTKMSVDEKHQTEALDATEVQSDSKTKTSPPGSHGDEIFSQISPASLKTMCDMAHDKLSRRSNDSSDTKNMTTPSSAKSTQPSASSDTDSQNSKNSQESKLSLKPKVRRFLYPSLNQITKSSPKTVYGFKTTPRVVKNTDVRQTKIEESAASTPDKPPQKNITDTNTVLIKHEDNVINLKTENADIGEIRKGEHDSPHHLNTGDKLCKTSPELKSNIVLSQRTKTAIDNLVNDLDSEFFEEIEMSQDSNISSLEIKLIEHCEQFTGFSTASGKNMKLNTAALAKAEKILSADNLDNPPTPSLKNTSKSFSANSSFIHVDGPVSFRKSSIKCNNSGADSSVSFRNSSIISNDSAVNSPVSFKKSSIMSNDSAPNSFITSSHHDQEKLDSNLCDLDSNQKCFQQETDDLEAMLSDFISFKKKKNVSKNTSFSDGNNTFNKRLHDTTINRSFIADTAQVKDAIPDVNISAGGFSTASGNNIHVALKSGNRIMKEFADELSNDLSDSVPSNNKRSTNQNDASTNDTQNLEATHLTVSKKITPRRHNGFNPFKSPRIISKIIPDLINENKPVKLPKSSEISFDLNLRQSEVEMTKDDFRKEEEHFDTQMSEIMMQEISNLSQENIAVKPLDNKQLSSHYHIQQSESQKECNSESSQTMLNLNENVKTFFKMRKLSKHLKESNSQNSQDSETNTPPFITGHALKQPNSIKKIFLSEEPSIKRNQQFTKCQTTSKSLSSKEGCWESTSDKSASGVLGTQSLKNLAEPLQSSYNFKSLSEINQSLSNETINSGVSLMSRPTCFVAPMLQTASGKTVEIKEESLQHIRDVLDFDDNVDEENNHVPDSKCQHSDEDTPDEQTVPNCVESSVSDIAAEPSGHIVHDDNAQRTDQSIVPQLKQAVKGFRNDSITSNTLKQIPDSTHALPSKPNFGFQTASGHNVQVNQKSLLHAKSLFDEETLLNLEKAKLIDNSKQASMDCEPLDQLGETSGTSYKFSSTLQTASGKDIFVSKKSVEHVQNMLHDDNCRTLEPSRTGTCENKLNEQNVPTEMKRTGTSESDPNCSDSSPYNPFQTASGKTVKVSQQSLNYVQTLKETEPKNDVSCDLDTRAIKDSCSGATQDKLLCNNREYDYKLSLCQNDLESDETFMDRSLIPNTTKPLNNLFQTAFGRDISVKEGSLKHVQEMFSDNCADNSHKGASNLFQTASGRDVSVNEASLKHVQNVFSDDLNNIPDQVALNKTQIPKSKNLFQTASGRDISVNEASLKHVQNVFSDDVDNIPDQVAMNRNLIPKSNNLFQTASGRDISVKEGSLKHVQNVFSDDLNNIPDHVDLNKTQIPKSNNLFQTASGRDISVNEESLKHVQNVFSDDLNNIPDQVTLNKTQIPKSNNLFQTASGRDISVNEESLKHVQNVFSDDLNNIPDQVTLNKTQIPKSNNFFQTASERDISVNEASLKHVQNVFNDEVDNIPDQVALNRNLIPKSNNFFQTASGRDISVNEASLKHVQNVFSDDLNNIPDQVDLNKTQIPKSNNLFQTASRNDISVNEESLMQVQNVFSDDLEKHVFEAPPQAKMSVSGNPQNSDKIVKNVFQTAGGTDIFVSADSLKQVQHQTSEFETISRSNVNTPNINSHKQFGNESNNLSTNKAIGFSTSLTKNQEQKNELSGFNTPVHRSTNKAIAHGKSSEKNQERKDKLPGFNTPMHRSTSDDHDNLSSSMMRHNKHSKNSDLKEDRIKFEPVHSYPEYHHSDRKHKLYPVVSHTLKQTSNSYEDQLSSLLGQQKPVVKSTFQTPYRKTSNQSSDTEKKESVTKSTPFLAKRSLKLGGTPVKPLATPNRAVVETHCDEKLPECKSLQVDNEGLQCHLLEARMQQEKIIRNKKKRKVRPLPGQLSCVKSDKIETIKYEDLNRESLNRQMLLNRGCLASTIFVRSSTVDEHRFNLGDYYPNLNTNILVGDGAQLVPDNSGYAGKDEFYKSFLTMEGVDINLISEEWFYNHYRWIVWKLAAYEVSFPANFARRCLTPNNTMLQFKYRYDREIDQCQRSCIKKIVERDDTPCKRLVLCISDVRHDGTDTIVEVTDGWYCINTSLDTPLLDLVTKKRLGIGQKFVTSGADLVGSQDACSPLEIPESLKLRLSYNSTRPVCWSAKLGYQRDPRPLILPLTTLHSDGGHIGTVDIVVARIYPIMYMEKTAEGSCIFRTSELEEAIRRKHERNKEDMLNKMYAKLQSKMETSPDKDKRKRRSSKRWKQEDIDNLTTGEEIIEAVNNSLQPDEIQCMLSEHQINQMRNYQQIQLEEKQRKLHNEVQQSLSENQQVAMDRKVTPLLKIRVVGCSKKDIDNKSATLLTIWRPSNDWYQLQEGKRYKLYSLQASASKSRLESLSVHLTSTRQSRIQSLPIDENLLDVIYEPREVWSVCDLKVRKPVYKEFDFVGMVFDIENGRQGSMQIVHCIDKDGGFLNITFWHGLKAFGCEEILLTGRCFVACNLILKSSYGHVIVSDVLQEVTQISQSTKLTQHKRCLDKITSLSQETKNEMLEEATLKYQERQHNKYIAKTPEKRYSDLPLNLEDCFSPISDAELSLSTACDVSPEEIAKRKQKKIIRDKTSKLMAYGSPRPLSPIDCVVSPAVHKAFKTPILKKKPS